MISFSIMLIVFLFGYTAIALEHQLKIDKAATAILIGVVAWTIYALNAESLLNLGFSPSWLDAKETAKDITQYIIPHLPNGDIIAPLHHSLEIGHHALTFVVAELEEHLIEMSEILFFLLGAMVIVETVDQYRGFKIITDKITTRSKVKLIWILSILAFFMSSVLDNLTTTIVMIALLRKLIEDKKTRWFFVSMVILAANAGGAWSPIGDITTIMLWIKGNVTTPSIIGNLFVPCLVTLFLPLIIISFQMKGNLRVHKNDNEKDIVSPRAQLVVLLVGVSALLFVPIFKTVTHLPPYMGMLFGLGTLWFVTEVGLRTRDEKYDRRNFSVIGVMKKIDTATIFFFLGILTIVAALQSVGHLALLAKWLDKTTGQNIYVINLAIGALSSIVDNVPLVASAMGMYNIAHTGVFATNGAFWLLLAYCAGTGGSLLIIGSAAGVAAMGLEKINFFWYFKKISLLATVGYLGGAACFVLQGLLFS